jgi:hypothetical protein
MATANDPKTMVRNLKDGEKFRLFGRNYVATTQHDKDKRRTLCVDQFGVQEWMADELAVRLGHR